MGVAALGRSFLSFYSFFTPSGIGFFPLLEILRFECMRIVRISCLGKKVSFWPIGSEKPNFTAQLQYNGSLDPFASLPTRIFTYLYTVCQALQKYFILTEKELLRPVCHPLQLAIRSLHWLLTILILEIGDLATHPAKSGKALSQDGV